jgi:hypothetical protein
MKRIHKSCLLVLICICIGAVLLVIKPVIMLTAPTNNRDNQDHHKQKEMLKICLEVGDLAPIPAGARMQSIKTEGNPFTRSFRVVFTANERTIHQWLQRSNGVQHARIVKEGKRTKYILNPRNGFNGAEVVVEPDRHTIEIYVQYS